MTGLCGCLLGAGQEGGKDEKADGTAIPISDILYMISTGSPQADNRTYSNCPYLNNRSPSDEIL